jgi:Cellulase (glycosyl hydrolase family 5)
MKFSRNFVWFLLVPAILSCGSDHEVQPPLSLNPVNAHYFLFRGKPEILIGSTEHYGAVLNLDFNYIKYLDELSSSGMNVTRTFSGVYLEPAGAFGIAANTLAPSSERYICPWARSSRPGFATGGNKFDLSKWDKDYFSRLKDFISEAGKRKIIVELDLFSNFYDTVQWKLSPLYINNNINGIGNIQDQREILSLKHPEIIEIQEKMVRKIVNELRDFDNLYYEICNEPYFGDTLALREWEKHFTGVVMDAENKFHYKHLISNNVANNYLKVENPRPGVSIYNFHYAHPPLAVDLNYTLNKVIGDNETGFDGINDARYRKEAWNFILEGGGLFDNLDYSFSAGYEDGSLKVVSGQPGGGGKTLRNQLKILADFMKAFDFTDMEVIKTGRLTPVVSGEVQIRGLAKGNDIVALYFQRHDTLTKSSEFETVLPAGSYLLTWTDTKTGKESNDEINDHKGGIIKIATPYFCDDIALKILKSK